MSKSRVPRRPTPIIVTPHIIISPEPSRDFAEWAQFTPEALYRFWDADMDLLYIGVSNNLPNRLKGHSKRSVWWPEIACCLIETHRTRRDVLDAEHWAIVNEGPIYNRSMNEQGFMWTTREVGYLRGAH